MNEPIISQVVTHLWQISVLFIAIYLLCKVKQVKKRPHLVLLFWVLFLIKCLVPPVVQSPVNILSALTPNSIQQPSGDWTRENPAVHASSGKGLNSNASPVDSLNAETNPPHEIPGFPIQGLVKLWSAGTLIVFLFFCVNYIFVKRRIYSAMSSERSQPNIQSAERILIELRKRIGVASQSAKLIISDQSLGPLVFGLFRPTIVLPSEILEKNIPLRPIIAHELCHIWRRDHLLGFLQIAAQSLFWFHPFVWLASKRVNHLCEVCCDDDAMRIFELNSQSYANGLLDVLAMQRVVKPIALTPGIRPIEVTKRRLKLIVSNQRIRARQSQMIFGCIFLFLAIPSATPNNLKSNTRSAEASRPGKGLLNAAEVAQRRTEMDFMLGDWKVTGVNGEDAGESNFAYEKSGKMIREDWISKNSTAQGITFFDPNEQCWKLTWVDSEGVIMESAGQWDGRSLSLTGALTTKTGIRKAAQIKILKHDSNLFHTEMHIEINEKMQLVSQSTYRRKTSQ